MNGSWLLASDRSLIASLRRMDLAIELVRADDPSYEPSLMVRQVRARLCARWN